MEPRNSVHSVVRDSKRSAWGPEICASNYPHKDWPMWPWGHPCTSDTGELTLKKDLPPRALRVPGGLHRDAQLWVPSHLWQEGNGHHGPSTCCPEAEPALSGQALQEDLMDTGCTAEHRQPSASWGPPGSRRWLQRAAIWGQEVWQKQSPEVFLLLSVSMTRALRP